MSKSIIESDFKGVTTYTLDVWVADYTEQSRLQGLRMTPEEKAKLKTAVHIQDSDFADIKAFHLSNQNTVPLFAVNFEDNKSFFPSGEKDCECMFRAKGVKHGWLLLCELKYCLNKPKNILDNGGKAIKQLLSTWNLLASHRPALFDSKHSNSYLNICFPNGNSSIPFEAFQISQNDILTLNKNSKIKLLGVNDILVVSNGRLNILPPKI